MLIKNITSFFPSLLLCLTLSHAGEHTEDESKHVKMTMKEALPLLSSIDDISIKLGNGRSNIYVFVDPLCPHSRNFIGMISENEGLMKKYTYHIWLYRLAKFDSMDHILSIYAHNKESRFGLVKKIMVDADERLRETDVDFETINAYGRIVSVADKLDIYKRPYLFIDKKE